MKKYFFMKKAPALSWLAISLMISGAFAGDSCPEETRVFQAVRVVDSAHFPAAFKELLSFFVDGSTPTPLLFKGAAASWPIMNLTLDGLKNDYGDQSVLVITKNRDGYLNKDYNRHISLRDHIEAVQADPSSPNYLITFANSEESEDDEGLEEEDIKFLGFLATNRDLIAQARFPADDDLGTKEATTFFLGGKTTADFHNDNEHNLFAQILGSKVFYLVDPQYINHLCCEIAVIVNDVSNTVSPGGCRVGDPEIPLAEIETICPAFKRLPIIYRVTVDAGDVLYIPPKWLHRVVSQGVSISMSQFYELTLP